MACTNCHTDNAGNLAHKNGSVSFTVNFGAARIAGLTGGNYDLDGVGPYSTVSPVPSTTTSSRFCGNLYCHSTGEPRGTETRVDRTTTQWAVTASGDCGSCHAVDGVSGTMLTNVHETHTGLVALGRYAIACATCHATVVNGTPAIISTTLHVNNSNNVAFAANEGTYGAVAGDCTATYCHSRGLDWTAAYAQGVNAPQTTPDWDTGSAGCNYCHGDASVAYPNYANNLSFDPGSGAVSKRNSHAEHSGFSCSVCHSATVDAGNAIIAPGNHANKVWNVVAGGTASFTLTPGTGTIAGNVYTPASCTTINCHSGGNATWGLPLVNGCFACHTGAETGAAKPSGAANGVANPVVLADYNATGHGRTGTNYPGSNNPPAGYTYNGATNNCYDCHDAAASHAPATSAADPYRLGVYATNTLGLCDVCHGPTGTASTKINIQEHTRTITGSTRTWPANYNFKCVDCHDPHGDANYQMVRSHISAPSASTETAGNFGSNSYGTPFDSANASVVTFTSTVGFGVGSYGISGSGDGICEVCHNQTAYFQRGIVAVQTHNTATQCTACHKHTEGFKGGACFSCHGNGTTQYWPDGAGNDRGTTAYTMFDNDGEHTAHLTAMALKLYNESLATLVTTTGNGSSDTKQKAICGYCHLLGDGDHTSLSNATQAEVFPAGGNKSLWGAVDNAAFSAATFNCTVTDCHNNKDTTPTYTWYAGAASACIMCHLDIPTDTTHVAHSGAPSANYGNTFSCDTCHYPTTWVTTPTAPATGHINGSWTMEFTYPPASWAGVGYNGSWSTGLHSSCGTGGINPCHRADLANNPPLRATYSWGTALTDDCASCHAGTAIATNKHAQHLGSNALPLATALTFNTSDECGACHNQTTVSGNGRASGNQHIDNSLDVSFAATYDYEAVGGTGSTGTGGARTCSDIRCHNGVTTPGWNATITCGQCHGDGTGSANSEPGPTMTPSVTGSHAQHIDGVPATFTDCAECHLNATLYTATGGQPAHQNLAVTVNVVTATYADNVTIAGDAGGVNYLAGGTTHTDNGTCTFTSGCHNAAAPVWGGALANGCFDCHGGAEAAGQAKPTGASNSVPNGVTLAGQYDTSGHGRASGTYTGSGNPAANYTYNGVTNNCYSCHASAASHAPATSAADPYRLGVYATNTLGLCDVCHGPTGTASTKINIQEHTRTITGSTRTWPANYNFKCVDCHDPHGDANYQMVRSHISAPSASTETAGNFGSNSYGTPFDSANASAVTFTSTVGFGVGSYGISGSGDGICEVCHNQTAYFQRGIVAVQTHNTATQCTACHKHTEGFKGGACFSCHGNGTTQYWPDGAGNDRGTTAFTMFDNDGEHTAHLTAMALKLYNESLATLVTTTGNGSSDTKQKAICGYCHLLGDGDHTSLSNATQAEVFPAGGNKSLWGAVDNAAFSAATYNCTVTDCHNNKDTTPTYTWYAGVASACIMCHLDIPTDTTHVAHSGAPSANYGNTFSCDTCHYPTTWVTTPTAPATGHINGSWTMEFTYPPASWAGIGYNGSWSTGLHSSCGTGGINPCHRADLANNPPLRATYSWGTALTDDCASCHAGTAIATNKHAQHLGSNALPLATALTFNTSDECGACHNQTTVSGNGRASGNQHIDNSLDVSFRAASDYEAVGGTGSTGTGAARTCSDIRCHNGVTTPGWSATITCGQCHGDGTGSASSEPGPTMTPSVTGQPRAAHRRGGRGLHGLRRVSPQRDALHGDRGQPAHQNLAVDGDRRDGDVRGQRDDRRGRRRGELPGRGHDAHRQRDLHLHQRLPQRGSPGLGRGARHRLLRLSHGGGNGRGQAGGGGQLGAEPGGAGGLQRDGTRAHRDELPGVEQPAGGVHLQRGDEQLLRLPRHGGVARPGDICGRPVPVGGLRDEHGRGLRQVPPDRSGDEDQHAGAHPDDHRLDADLAGDELQLQVR